MASAQRPLAGDVGPASLGYPHRRDSGHRRCRDLLSPRLRHRHRGRHLGRPAPDIGPTDRRGGVSLSSAGPGADSAEPQQRRSAVPDDRGPLPGRRLWSAVVAGNRPPSGVGWRSRSARLAHSAIRAALIEQPRQLRIHPDVALQAVKELAVPLWLAPILRGRIHGSTVRGREADADSASQGCAYRRGARGEVQRARLAVSASSPPHPSQAGSARRAAVRSAPSTTWSIPTTCPTTAASRVDVAAYGLDRSGE